MNINTIQRNINAGRLTRLIFSRIHHGTGTNGVVLLKSAATGRIHAFAQIVHNENNSD